MLAAKLPDPELLELAEEGGGSRVSVIVELDLPEQRVEMARPGAGGERLARPLAVAAESDEDSRQGEAVIERARQELRRLSGEEPVHLRAARAFAVRVDGGQLREIVRSPWARRVRRNRSLRR